MKIKYILAAMLAIGAQGCYGDQGRVETGEVGKLLGASGLDNGIIKPSAFRLPWCGGAGSVCSKLVRLQITKQTQKVTIDQVFIQKSKVDLSKVEIAIQFRARKDDKSINLIFNEIPAGEGGLISAEDVWKTYLQRQVPDVVVSVLRQYDVEGILTKIPEITKECHKALNKAVADNPVEVTEVAFPNGIGDLPETVVASYRKLYAVEADKQRRIKALAADLEVEKQRLAVQKVRAENDIAISKSLNVPVSSYMKLKISEKYADAVGEASDNDQPFALGTLPLMDSK